MEQDNQQSEINVKGDLDITYINPSQNRHKYWHKNLMTRCKIDNNFLIGGRLVNYIEEWKQINIDQMIMREIKAYWKSHLSLLILNPNCRVPIQRRSKQSEVILSQLMEKELEEQIIEEVFMEDLKWINPCFAIPKQEKGKW
ncbi:MAG: hypothetical protein EZS28_011395 [Streblomastix strix]|uniref:Uncharacterized protein n=1 Tax=Streblomastix strix TaxID=222440 RepID=A0A5J4WDN1_9EUKA|nr:MAG: hypothetical protein EZS28_011395 [Streblomastix strix]